MVEVSPVYLGLEGLAGNARRQHIDCALGAYLLPVNVFAQAPWNVALFKSGPQLLTCGEPERQIGDL